jgi:hypothetical protein
MSGFADKQVSIGQQTLDRLDAQLASAKEQIDAMKGVDTSVKDVATAVRDFDTAMQALGAAKSSIGSYSFAAPSGGGASYGGGGGGGGSSSQAKLEDIVGQDNKDIVAAYREYYNRNPDAAGYEAFVNSKLTGDKLMKAILGASVADVNGQDYQTAVSKGYDPLNPDAKFLKSKVVGTSGSDIVVDGSFAKGINNVPNDMVAQIHKGERILPAADNAELFARLQDPKESSAVLAAAVARLTNEVVMLRSETRQTVVNTGDTSRMLKRLGGEEDILTVKVQA